MNAVPIVGHENVPEAATPSARPSVLIVDDDEVVAMTFARMLRLEGYDVRTALSAADGLRMAQDSAPDAIVLDLRMPTIDGLGFLRQLRSRHEHRAIPAVVVTGDYFVNDETVAELRALGANVRFKPVWLEELITLTRQLLGAKE
jgi:CheY-like chemotaxis protein